MTEEQMLSAVMNEMANLYPSKTGLSVVCWFGEVGGQHGPQLKVSNVPGKFDVNNCFIMSISKKPEVLTPKSAKISSVKISDVEDWIKLNYHQLMELWKIHETGDGDVEPILASLQKI